MALRPQTKIAAAEQRPVAARGRRRGGWRPDRQLEGYLFLLPSLAGFLLFTLLPIAAAFVLSFYRWNLIRPPEFIGLQNYAELLTRDTIFPKAFWNTVYFTLTIVPLQLIFGLALAVALNQAIRGMIGYRLIYFMPVVTSIVAAALVFQGLFNRDFGIVNDVLWRIRDLTGLAFTPPDWMGSSRWAKPAIVVLTLWKNTGFTMVIYLAALQSVPVELHEAAKVDGASVWQRFRNITVPLVSPTTFFLLVYQMIGAFQLFSEPYVMSRGEGGPAQATLTIVFYVYQNAFEYGRMGKAAAIAWILFIFILIFTLIQNRLQKRWVHYEVGGS